MGKKNKKSSKLQKSTSFISCDNFMSLEDEIVQHLQLLKEEGKLVIGLNAVLRGLKKKSFCVVILISRKATSAMYHALNMMCKNTEVLFLQLQDINSITSQSKIPSSTAYGIKICILTEQQKFETLIEKINRSRNSQKFKKQKNPENFSVTSDTHKLFNENAVDSDCYKKENYGPESGNLGLAVENQCHRTESNSFIHSNHIQSVMKFSGSVESFLTLENIDFPNYNFRSNEISFCVK